MKKPEFTRELSDKLTNLYLAIMKDLKDGMTEAQVAQKMIDQYGSQTAEDLIYILVDFSKKLEIQK